MQEYKNRFEAFKDRYFPSLLKRLWPVQYSEFWKHFSDVAISRYEMIDNGDGTYTHNFTFVGKVES